MLLRTENLTKIYGMEDAKVVALDHVSMSVEKGEFVSVMGASGSGKSTLLNLLGGLDSPTEGAVYYNDKNIYEMNDDALSKFRLDAIGFVFQSYNLIPELTVRDNILLPFSIAKKKEDASRFEGVVKMLGLGDRLAHLPSQLSGGQQQRVAIARALMNDPEILLCDEPTGNLDHDTGESVMRMLKTLNAEYGITIVIITHDAALAAETARTLRIADGRLEA